MTEYSALITEHQAAAILATMPEGSGRKRYTTDSLRNEAGSQYLSVTIHTGFHLARDGNKGVWKISIDPDTYRLIQAWEGTK